MDLPSRTLEKKQKVPNSKAKNHQKSPEVRKTRVRVTGPQDLSPTSPSRPGRPFMAGSRRPWRETSGFLGSEGRLVSALKGNFSLFTVIRRVPRYCQSAFKSLLCGMLDPSTSELHCLQAMQQREILSLSHFPYSLLQTILVQEVELSSLSTFEKPKNEKWLLDKQLLGFGRNN